MYFVGPLETIPNVRRKLDHYLNLGLNTVAVRLSTGRPRAVAATACTHEPRPRLCGVHPALSGYLGCLRNRSSSLSVPRMKTVEVSIVASYVSSDLVKA